MFYIIFISFASYEHFLTLCINLGKFQTIPCKLDLRIREPLQICIHRRDNSTKPVNHCLTLKEGPKVKANIRRFLAQELV